MIRKPFGQLRNFSFFAMLVGGIVAVDVRAQVPATPRLGMAEVSGNDVYVRSGPSSNHYPVLKLSAGARVSVVGERGVWYEVVPPAGAFSFISGDYVDSADGKTGVVNGDNVRVRAGSVVAAFAKLKYTIQTKLSKGAVVTILKRDPDGFLRITPPKGVTLWISQEFLQFVPDDKLGHEGQMEQPASVAPDAAVAKKPADPNDPLAGLQATPRRTVLKELDAAVRTELEKPVGDRKFDGLIEPYRAIAAQDDDEFAQRYAAGRIEQLTNMAALIDAVRKMRTLGHEADEKRRDFMEARAKIGSTFPDIPHGIEVQGELRTSAVYPPGSPHERYRLIAVGPGEARTIGYIEIPADAGIEVESFLGRYVGVRASAKRLHRGGVDALPIYVAEELVLLQSAEREHGSAGGQ